MRLSTSLLRNLEHLLKPMHLMPTVILTAKNWRRVSGNFYRQVQLAATYNFYIHVHLQLMHTQMPRLKTFVEFLTEKSPDSRLMPIVDGTSSSHLPSAVQQHRPNSMPNFQMTRQHQEILHTKQQRLQLQMPKLRLMHLTRLWMKMR